MKLVRLWTKISWVIALLLSAFYLGSGILFWVQGMQDKIFMALIMSAGFFFLSTVLKKALGQNKSLKKMMQSAVYIYSKHSNNYDLNQHRLIQLLYLSDLKTSQVTSQPLFPDTPWKYENGLSNIGFDAIKSFLPKLADLKSKHLDPLFMVPPHDLTKEEIQVLDEVLARQGEKNPVELQQKVIATYEILQKQNTPINLVEMVKANPDTINKALE